MNESTTIGLDTAKSVFQIHGVDANDEVVVRSIDDGEAPAWDT